MSSSQHPASQAAKAETSALDATEPKYTPGDRRGSVVARFASGASLAL